MKFLIVLFAAVAVSVAEPKPGYVDGGYAGLGLYGAHAGLGYAATVLTPQGVPVDTPEVQAARAAHYAAHANAGGAAAYAAPALYGAHAGLGYGYPHAATVLTPQGVPVDTPDVQAARAAHYAAHANAGAAAGLYGAHAGYGYGAAHIALTPAGVPVDTPEVQAARAANAVAHINAKTGHLYG